MLMIHVHVHVCTDIHTNCVYTYIHNGIHRHTFCKENIVLQGNLVLHNTQKAHELINTMFTWDYLNGKGT